MSPRHFSNMTSREAKQFNKDMQTITGMLYTVATLPLKPFIPAFYKTAGEVKKDYEPLYNPPIEE